MRTRLIRLRFRRRVRKGQQQVGDLGTQAEDHINRHLLKRFERLLPVRRFVIGWLSLLVLLIGSLVAQNLFLSGYYQSTRTVPGGIYNEGVLGRFTTANPLFASSDADTTVARLVFAGLFTYDNTGNLTGDLAKDYSVDAQGATYTVRLKPNLKWHDGRPLTSSDVVFTYQLIQNPDVQSPLQSAWQGIEISAPDANTVVFKLPGVLAAFPYSMTNGIVPKHLLSGVSSDALRSADFNTMRPVGAGPFVWQAIQVAGDGNPRHAQQRIALTPFADYQAGKPKLQKLVVQVFADKSQLIQAFADNQLTAVEGLSELHSEFRDNDQVVQHSLPLRAATMVFFKTSSGVLANQKVRQALVRGTNIPQIIQRLDYSTRAVKQPLLIGQLGYDPLLNQAAFDSKAAEALLEADGWVLNKDGVRSKDGRPLSFILTAADTPEYRMVTRQLQQQWKKLGVKVEIQILDALEFQNALSTHSYDSILYGISIGTDPDVFVYWDSSQADIRSTNRLNLSEYKNATADVALEAGRTRHDPALRVIKYKPFLQAWQQDSPALGLYQPRVLYLTNGPVDGLSEQPINTATDRFTNIHNWQIRQARVTNEVPY